MTQRVGISGLVTIKSGDDIIYKDVPNHWVNAGLRGLASYICGYQQYCTANNGSYYYSYAWSYSPNIKVGTDTSTITSYGTSNLINPNTNSPNGFSATNVLNPSVGNWKITYTGTWNAGIITGSVGEIGLFLYPFDNMTAQWSEGSISKTQVLVARISSADGTFTAFTPDPAKVFTVEWSVAVGMA